MLGVVWSWWSWQAVRHVKATWAQYCDITLYMSSKTNHSFPTIGLNVPSGRSHIDTKSRKAWIYIHAHYLNAADYFVKADPDTFLVIHDLKLYLSKRNPDRPEYFGHRLKLRNRDLKYDSGGAGIVLRGEAVRRMVGIAFTRPGPHCMPDGEGMN